MSVISELRLDVESELKFEFSVSGADQKDVLATLEIKTDQGYNVSIPGKSDGANLTFDLPKLEGIVPPGVVDFGLQIVVESDKFFVPMNEQIEFTQPTRVEAKLDNVKTQSKVLPSVSVKVKTEQKTVQNTRGGAKDLIKAQLGEDAIIDSLKPNKLEESQWFAIVDDKNYVVDTAKSLVSESS